MSSAKQGLRRASIGGLSAAVGATVMFGLAVAPANAAAPTGPGDLTADSTPSLTVGLTDQPAGDLHYEFSNNYGTNTQLTFTVADSDLAGNNCANAGDEGVEFNALPTISITPADPASTATAPSYSATLGYSSDACKTVGVADQVTVTLNGGQPSTGNENFVINLTNVDYNVGAQAAVGDANVTANETTGGTPVVGASDTAANGKIVAKSFTFIPLKSATPGSTGNDLGTATMKEARAGAYFNATKGSITQVDLVLSDGKFTPKVTPTITASGGYTVYSDPTATKEGEPATTGTDAATATNTYTFYLKAPADADATAATVTVSGLDANAPGTVEVVDIAPSTGPVAAPVATGDSSKALNVVKQDRFGGSNRYATAAKVFEQGIAAGSYTDPTSVVLSGGQKFPDALSANYLAQSVGTGTLLTKQDELPTLTKKAIIDNGIDTVYITGETAAVSQGVEDEIANMYVSNNPATDKKIQVIRLGGANRYETNATINRSQLQSSNTAVLAAGTAPYDSLAVGPVVYHNGIPLVLTRGSKLNSGEEGQFQDFGVNNVIIVGGPAVVSDGIQEQLVADGYDVTRVSGATRYATATAIATWATVGYDANADGDTADAGDLAPAGLTATTTNIANGKAFPDALSDGPVAGSLLQPLVLSKGATDVGPALESYLNGKTVGTTAGGTEIEQLNALGLTDATAPAMIDAAAAAIGNK